MADEMSSARFITFLFFLGGYSWAESAPRPCPNPTVEELRITMGLSSAEIPPPLQKPIPIVRLECERPFIFKSEVYPSDSPQSQDVSNLKYFVQSVPEANVLLSRYQDNRRLARYSAYTGSIGLGLIILANVVGRRVLAESYRDGIVSGMQITGSSLTLWGFINSFLILRGNETLIPKAVDAYNAAQPDSPIELKFQTGWSF
jgi:hypothetical protein